MSASGLRPHTHAATGQGSKLNPANALTLPADATKYLDGTGSFTVPAGGGGGGGGSLSFDPTSFLVYDDCFHADTTATLNGGVRLASSGTGAGVSDMTVGVDHPGISLLTTGTTTTGRAALASPATIYSSEHGLHFGAIVAIPSLSTSTDTFKVRVGLGETLSTADNGQGIFFRYTDTQGSDAMDGKWQMVITSGGETRTDSGVTVGAATWYQLEFQMDALGYPVEFFINGVSVGSINDNPGINLTLCPGVVHKSAGTAARTLRVDAYWLTLSDTLARY